MGSKVGIAVLKVVLILIIMMVIFHLALHVYFNRPAADERVIPKKKLEYEMTVDEAKERAKIFDVDESILQGED